MTLVWIQLQLCLCINKVIVCLMRVTKLPWVCLKTGVYMQYIYIQLYSIKARGRGGSTEPMKLSIIWQKVVKTVIAHTCMIESLPNSSFVTVEVSLTITMATKGRHGCNLNSLLDAFRPTRLPSLSSVQGILGFYYKRWFSFCCNYTNSSERSPWNIHLTLSKYPKDSVSYNILCMMSKRLKAFMVSGTASITNFTGFSFSSCCYNSFILVLF